MPEYLKDFYILETLPNFKKYLEETLINPVLNLISRPRKGFRKKLVQLSFQIAKGESNLSSHDNYLCEIASEMVEFLHAGTLAIDDIQDDSSFRRGEPTLHKKF